MSTKEQLPTATTLAKPPTRTTGTAQPKISVEHSASSSGEPAMNQASKPSVSRETYFSSSNPQIADVDSNTESSAPVDTDNTPAMPEPTHYLTLNSQVAQSLWEGRKPSDQSKHIAGCLEFARFARDICYCARDLDDPYAIFQLIKIERELNRLEQHVASKLYYLKTLLQEDEDSGLSYCAPFMKSFSPQEYPVLFASGYSYAAARLLSKYDKVIVLSITARNCALMPDSDWETTVPETTKMLRVLFNLGTRFRHSGITRDDFASKNARAQEAIEKFGAIPDDVITGSLSPELLPKSWRAAQRRKSK